MRKIAIALTTAAALLGTVAADARPRQTPQQRLDKVLAGRVAGEPVNCIPQWQAREMQVFDKTAIVFGAGDTVWVNVPHNRDHLDDDDIMVTRTSTGELCSIDIVQTLDRAGRFPNGFLNLGKFVPFRKAAKDN